MKKILIILGHPNKNSLNGSIVNAYANGAKKGGHEVKKLYLGDLKFNPILKKGYKEIQELEPDLKEAQKLITWAEHIVIVYPTWWFNMPAILKGFIDRAILPGFAFKYEKGKQLPNKLLKGRTGRIIVTSNSPSWYYTAVTLGNPGIKSLKNGTLEFCGVSPVHKTIFGPVKKTTKEKRKKWLKHIEELGRKGE